MKVKILLILVLSVTTLTAFAQDGGVRGRVVSRAGRVALDGVKVTMTPGDVTVMSDERGNFLIRMSLRANTRCSSRPPSSNPSPSPCAWGRRCATSMRSCWCPTCPGR